jgi:type I restriction enzyme S subunit
MSFPRYPTYKPSGVEWLGEVPEHWQTGQSRRRFALRNERALDGEEQLTASQKHGIIKQADFVESEGRRVVEVIKGADILKHVEAGDFVISMRSFQGGIEYSPHCGSISSAYVMLKPIKDVHPDFFRWLFKSSRYIQALQSTSNLVRDGQALRFSNFAQVNIPVIPLSEQASIAAFLDREIAKIDALIAEQQRLIELLQEKRQAVISHAVTKGLNPDALMKDSGVDWLGEVPKHWEVIQLKWLTPVKRGASPRPIDDPIYFDEEGEYAWVRISDVTESAGRLRSTTQRLSSLGSDLSVKLEPGSLFLSIAGSVGKPCISEINACIHDGFVYFPNLPIMPEYLFIVFESGACFGGLGKLGTQLNLNTDTIGSISVALPPGAEIEYILRHCSYKSIELHALSQHASRFIELLQERRSALISAAVTGQIDVRGLVPEASAA